MSRYFIILNCKVVADRKTLKGAYSCAERYRAKYPAPDNDILIHDDQTLDFITID